MCVCPPLGIWPAAQACAPTGNRASDPLVHRLALNPLSFTSMGSILTFEDMTRFTMLKGREKNVIFFQGLRGNCYLKFSCVLGVRWHGTFVSSHSSLITTTPQHGSLHSHHFPRDSTSQHPNQVQSQVTFQALQNSSL